MKKTTEHTSAVTPRAAGTRQSWTSRAFALLGILGLAAAAHAEYYGWTGASETDTNYSTPSNWGVETGYPGAGDGAMFTEAAAEKTVTFNGTYSPEWVWVATGDVLTPVTWEAATSADGMTVAGNIGVADAGNQTGSLKAVSGTYTAGGLFKAGYGTGSSAKVEFLGGNYTFNGATVESFWNGDGNPNAEFTFGAEVGTGIGFAADIEIQNATVAFPNGAIGLGFWGTWQGDYDSAEANPDALAVGHVTVDINNGGVLSCGSIESPRELFLGGFGVEPITVNVNQGGTLKVGSIVRHFAGGASSVNLDGGTLEVLGTDTANFFPANGVAFTVGSNGATLNTNGKEITIDAAVTGTGTLNVTGGGKVTFTVEPTCTVSSSDDTPFVRPSDMPANAYYWVGGAVGEADRKAFSATAGSWSSTDGGEPIADFVPGEGDTAVFTTPGVNLYANNIAANIRALADVSFYNHDTKNDYTMSGDLYIEAGVTLSIKALKSHKLTQSGAVTGSGILRAYAETQSSTVDINGDTSAFKGNVNFVVGSDNTLAACRIGNAAATSNALSAWNIFLTENSIVPYRDATRNQYTAFPLNDTTYKFGSLNAIVSYPNTSPANSKFVIGGRDTEDSSVYGQFQGSGNTIEWNADSAVKSDVTLTLGVVNCAGLTVAGGGIVKFMSADALPAAFTLSNKGAYLAMAADADLNAAVAAAVTKIGEGVPVGFYSSEADETSVNLLPATALVGQTLCKRGSGTVFLTKLPASGVNDIVVSEGTLVLPHGAVVGNVTVAENALLLVELTGAEDNEVVFKYESISGDVSYRSLSSIGKIEKDDEAKTWTYIVTGSARTFKWNGEEGAAWTEASNWLIVDGESETTATDIPSTIDTVLFDKNATISASGTLAGDVQIAEGVTLTIPAGLTFSKLTAASGAKIAFSADPIGTVGGTLTLISVGQGSGVSDAFVLPPTYSVGVDAVSGAFTATRTSGTYTWTNAKEDNNWATRGNWKVDDFVVPEVPAAEDTVVFPASDAEGFKAWTVTLPWDVYADTVTLNAAVELSGARTLKAHTINGSAELKLNNAHIGCNGQAMIVNCPLNILPETTDYIYLMGYNATLNGALYGSGKLVSDANKVQNTGVTFNGDVNQFYGEFETTNYNNRDHTDMAASLYGSEHAVWRTSPSAGGANGPAQEYIIHSESTLYKFGAYVGGFWVGKLNPQIEIGARADVDSSFSLYSYGVRSKYKITKVGSGSMTITNKKDDSQIGTLYPNDGASIIYTTPETITFGGGALKTPIYETITGKAIKYIYVNATDATDERVLDEDAGTSFTEEDVVYNYKESKEVDVSGPYYPDVSAVIKGSTGPIWFDTDGADYTWAATLDYSNKGGLTKSGSGTLTLATEPNYTGVTWVQAGTLVVPEGTSITLDPRSLGTVRDATVTGYAYRPDTVLDGTETGDDSRDGNIDVSGIRKIDISDPSYVDALVNQRRVVLCGTTGSITGLDFRHFVQGETLLVPERPEEVSEKNWDWSVRIMQVDGKRCLCVAPRVVPFAIRIR